MNRKLLLLVGRLCQTPIAVATALWAVTFTALAVDTKISDMPAASSVSGADVVPIVQGGVNKKSSFSVINTYAGGALISDTAFGSGWNSVTGVAPSKNAVYDYVHQFDTDDDGKVNVLDQVAGITNTNSSGIIQTPLTASGILDDITATQGRIIFRGASAWTSLPNGTDGYILTTHSAAANPTWESPSSLVVSDTAYDATTWNGDTTHAPSKNAVRDKIETLSAGGTVTHTGGALTSNAVVLGAGTDDVKVVAGIITDGTAKLTLGVNTTTLGQLKLFGNTSGDATIQPAAVAGTSTVVTLPNASSTLPIFGQQITFSGPTAARTVTFPDAAFTAARTDAANTFTGHQTIEGVTSTGATGTGKFVFDTAPQISTIELGAASDTTIARVGAGQISVEGVNVVTTSSTDTLTNKRINPRIENSTAANATTWSPNADTTDIFELAGALTVAVTTINNPSGTPVEGQKIMFRIKSDGSAHALSWTGSQYRASTASGAPAFPATTSSSKNLYGGIIWNSTDSKWDLLAVQDGF